MKRKLVLVGLVLLGSITGFSQKVDVEAFGRLCLTDIDVSNPNRESEDYLKPIIRLSAGTALNIPITSYSNIGVGLLVDSRGATTEEMEIRDEYNFVIGMVSFKELATYITLPVTYRWRSNSKVQVQIEGGGFISRLIDSKTTFSKKLPVTQNGDVITVREADHDGFFKSIDYGILLAVSFYVPIDEKLSLKFGLDNFFSLHNLSDYDTKIYQTSLGVSAGINYSFE